MKSLILLMFLAIGLMISLPLTSSGSGSPPGQVSFVVEHPAIAPAIAFVFVPEAVFVSYYSQSTPVTVADQEKGGYLIEQTYNSSLDIYYTNKDVIATAPAPTLTKVDLVDLRTCYYDVIAARNLKLLQRNKDWVSQLRIRADSHLG